MSLKMGYSTLFWSKSNPDLEPVLEALKTAGWDGWEGRFSLDWLGPPNRLRRICENTGMPFAVFTANGSPDNRKWEHVERNKRRMEYAAEMGADCFMFMSGPKPKGRGVTRDDIRAAAQGAEAWADYAAQFDLELSYHIHTNLSIDSAEDWRTYMGFLKRSKLCIDVSHSALWGYDPIAAIQDFRSQLNYIHLQDYSSTSRDEDGTYKPDFVSVGEGRSLDFAGILKTLEQIGFSRWVTSCPGRPFPADEEPISQARRSKKMRDYLRGLGY